MSATKKSRKLTPKEIEAFGAELDSVRQETMKSLGPREAKYIRDVQKMVRYSEIAGRGLLFASWLPPAWLAGTSLLSLSKIVENMELGHNVIHGQYDWMNEPSLRGDSYEWDFACSSEAWRHSHNYMHHTFTNIEGKDRDIGYSLLRLFPTQKWKPEHLFQSITALTLAANFQWGIALYDLELEKIPTGERKLSDLKDKVGPFLKKGLRQLGKDYVFFPVLAGPSALPVLAGNLTANLNRNLWAFAIIFCGHFTADADTFPEEILEGETRGSWYLRQLRGSSNLNGGKLMHFMSGNLSHQIEHHLFPDVPAMRYAEMSVKVRAICKKYGQHYNTGSFGSQLFSVAKRIVRYSLPNKPVTQKSVKKNVRRKQAIAA